MIEWKESYSTGFADIDDQHKRLFQIFNRFAENIATGVTQEHLEEMLDYMEEYIELHFGYEEECMFKHKCPVYNKNKTAHKQFIDFYQYYRVRYQNEGPTKELVDDIHKELENWMVNHICSIDVELNKCVPVETDSET